MAIKLNIGFWFAMLKHFELIELKRRVKILE